MLIKNKLLIQIAEESSNAEPSPNVKQRVPFSVVSLGCRDGGAEMGREKKEVKK